ncbi:DciA family protein [Corynebacterium halotolerans]|uniref:DciA family protein n=1 Tax=Corynebacterium halotolerans TaxID=225326 RepID=UPI003CF72C50
MEQNNNPLPPEQGDHGGTPGSDDSISAAFAELRAVAKRRSGTVPDLSRQGRSQLPRRRGAERKTDRGQIPGIPGLGGPPEDGKNAGEAAAKNEEAAEKRRPARGVGQPTGPDGRRLPRRPNLDNLGAVLGTEIVRRGWRRELAGGWVHSHWDTLVGEKIAQHTKVEMLKDKTLFITCDSTAWATNLRMMQRQILQAIAERVGPDVVAELKIHGPKAQNWYRGQIHVKGRGPRDTFG